METDKKKGKNPDSKIKLITVPEAKKLLPIDMDDLNLRPREYKFIAAYTSNGFVGYKAFAAAGYKSKKKNLQSSGASDLLSRANIIEGVRRFVSMAISPYKDRLEYQILEVYQKRAFYSLSSFFDEDGRALPLDKIPEEWQVAIDGIETKFYKDRQYPVFKLADRDKALSILWDYVQKAQSAETPSDKKKDLEELFNKYRPEENILEFPKTKEA